MFPFRDGFTYPRNAWYVAAWSSEITRTLCERRILGEPVVMFRTVGGTAVALDGRCPHRRFPLANGKLVGDEIECAYHGFTFDAGGACTRIPSTDRIQPGMRVAAYPLVERWNWVWIWMGDAEKADPALIPDHNTDLGLERNDMTAQVGGYLHVRCRHQLLHENILDLTHLAFIHAATLGSPQVARGPVTIASDDRTVRMTRFTEDEQPTQFYVDTLGLRGNIDREHVTTFFAPALHVVAVRVVEREAQRRSFMHHGIHAITPESPNSSHYFFASSRTYGRDDDVIGQKLRDGFYSAFVEDVVVLEVQEAMIANDGDRPRLELSVKADEGALRSRRVMDGLMAAERMVAV
jgi:vanillate O-demethylase monooxygenase subunit